MWLGGGCGWKVGGAGRWVRLEGGCSWKVGGAGRWVGLKVGGAGAEGMYGTILPLI